ncbi:type I-B CRISPR-associated protein Cas5b [Desulfothermus naphthae]
MKVYRVNISSWTASFRYPNLITNYQPTLPVPPLSTIIGLISAAKGSYFIPEVEKIGYVFLYKTKATDLETIYQIKYGKLREIKSNVIKREILFDTELFLYTDSRYIVDWLKKPKFPVLIGRSSDLASVNEIVELEVVEKNILDKLKGTIVPLKYGLIPGIIQALPKYFSNTIPRRNIGTEPYTVLDYKSGFVSAKANGFYDSEKDWDVLWQEF